MNKIFTISVLFIVTGVIQAETNTEPGGLIEATLNGERIRFPLLKSDYSVAIDGDLATVSLLQKFANPTEVPLHARYLFPLNQNAAVYRMQMIVGNEIIEAQIQEKHIATKSFNKAKREGKAASLLTQQRANVFTQKIANLMPGLPIEVKISYVQTVKKVDDSYELVIPLVVGPRFKPPLSRQPKLQIPLQAYPQVIPATIDKDRVTLDVSIQAPVFINKITSPTHTIKLAPLDAYHQKVSLTKGSTIANKDFVLRYQLSGRSLQAASLTTWREDSGYFSLLIEPPEAPHTDNILSREMVFVLDCSGSMSGTPLNASKTFMRKALAGLRPTDTFRIIRFSDRATEFSTSPLPATAQNIAAGIRYTNQLVGSGGTMMRSGVIQALEVSQQQSVRNVIFLTDGYIGNDFEILRLIEDNIGAARLFAFGVGTGVNRFLLSEMSRIGRGFTRYMDAEENVEQVATELAQRLQTPLLTEIEIDWSGIPVVGVTPARIPDLYQGDSIRIQGKLKKPGIYVLELTGNTPNSIFTENIHLTVSRDDSGSEAIPLIWARSRIKDHMHTYITPPPKRPDAVSNQWLQQRVTQLGLQHGLVTKWTAFVAVSRFIQNFRTATTKDVDVPLHQVKGVNKAAYPRASFGGYAAPEPHLTLSFILILVLGFGYYRFSRRTIRPSN